MICASCNGKVLWRGPLSALTHTQCTRCGRINNQRVELVEDEDEDEDESDQGAKHVE